MGRQNWGDVLSRGFQQRHEDRLRNRHRQRTGLQPGNLGADQRQLQYQEEERAYQIQTEQRHQQEMIILQQRLNLEQQNQNERQRREQLAEQARREQQRQLELQQQHLTQQREQEVTNLLQQEQEMAQYRNEIEQEREEMIEFMDQLEQQDNQDIQDHQDHLDQLQQQAANQAAPIHQPHNNLPLGRRPYHDPNHRHSILQMNVECPKCHALHFLSERLTASSQINPKFSTCCLQGAIHLPPFTNSPPTLYDLLSKRTTTARKFRKNIRQYNAAFAFTSIGVEVDQAILQSSGPYSFRIHGGLYHRMGSLLPTPGQSPSYAQLYILDPQLALNQRNARNNNLDPQVMNNLQTMLQAVNPFIPLYKQVSTFLFYLFSFFIHLFLI